MGSMHHSTFLPLVLAFEICRLCPLGRWGLPAALLPGAGEGDSPALPKCSREAPEEEMLLLGPNRAFVQFEQGRSTPSFGSSLQSSQAVPGGMG